MTAVLREPPNNQPEILDICIIGGGFAGMNAGRILATEGMKCEIFTSGMGASRFWAGTVDFLNREGSRMEVQFNQFKEILPAHPYALLQFKEILPHLTEFFKAFPDFVSFQEDGPLENRPILTSLGTQKPCIGAWGTIFRDFGAFQPDSLTILVDFREFNNSVMHLVAKGLGDNLPGKFRVLRLSFTELVTKWENPASNPPIFSKLNENLIAQYFDKHSDRCDVLADYIRAEIQVQFRSLLHLPITSVLFSPVFGIKNSTKIIRELSKKLEAKVGELAAFSPSLMSQRFYAQFMEKLEKLHVNIRNGYTLIRLERESRNKIPIWTCSFEDANGAQTTASSRYVILASGSLFHAGCLASDESLRDMLQKYTISIPNSLTPSFELISEHPSYRDTGIFSCGSATYLIRGGMTDEEEILYGTGLGLAIVTSAKVANEILLREARP